MDIFKLIIGLNPFGLILPLSSIQYLENIIILSLAPLNGGPNFISESAGLAGEVER